MKASVTETDELESVIPYRIARRRAYWAVGIALAAWLGFDAAVGLLVRGHQINERCTGYSMGAGGIAWFVVLPLWYGMSTRARLVTSGGRDYVVARTFTGQRAVALDELAGARRFQALGKGSKGVDELRLRDRRGIRLAIDHAHGMKEAISRGIESNGLRVSGAVRRKLDTGWRTGADGGGLALLGTFITIMTLGAFILGSLYVTSLIAGTPLNG